MATPTTARGWFDYFYPYFTLSGDPRFVNDAAIVLALEVAALYVPTCAEVTAQQKLQAQAHYAAYELGVRYENQAAGNGLTAGQVLIAEKMGEQEKRYSSPKTNAAASTVGDNSPYSRYLAIANLCPKPFGGFAVRTRRV